MTSSQDTVLRCIANLWTLQQHPSSAAEWTLPQKLQVIADSGFDGVCWAGSPELREQTQRLHLLFIGGMATAQPQDFALLLEDLRRFGAEHINVQLGTDDMLTPEALRLTLNLLRQAEALELHAAIETHRGTCTETPEKLYALADAYADATGNLLPISWDFSHFAVVKHLVSANFAERLLVRPDLIQRAQQFHLRPFNGHHAQVPITDGRGNLTREVHDWLPFAEAVLRCWLEGNRDSGRPLFVCPELGPIDGGYALSSFPNSWEDAQVLRREIEKLWQRINA